MKYKIGDKFTKKSDRFGLFKSGEIVAIHNNSYILEVEGHKNDDGIEGAFLVRRTERKLEEFYQKVEPFFELGATYRYKLGQHSYKIVELLKSENPVQLWELEALALMTRTDGQQRHVLLTLDDFSSMDKV